MSQSFVPHAMSGNHSVAEIDSMRVSGDSFEESDQITRYLGQAARRGDEVCRTVLLRMRLKLIAARAKAGAESLRAQVEAAKARGAS